MKAETLPSNPGLLLRIAQFPLTRIVVLGAGLYLLLGVKNGFRAQFASAPWMALAVVAAMSALGLAVYAAFVRFVERRAVSELSLPGMGRELGLGLLVGAVLYTLCVLILMLLGNYQIIRLNPWSFMLPAVSMALGSGVFEELVYRGVLFRVVEESLGSWISLLVSSLVFGIAHLHNENATLIGALSISVEAGLLLAGAYMLTRRLWMSIGFHFAWNFTQSGIFSGNVSGNDTGQGLIQASVQGSDWLTGGSFGLEASLVALLVGTATGVMFLILAARRGHVIVPFWKRKPG
ncbi:MAG: CPBP family intramembrane metalloprotease [Rhodoferax sp.]|jgi:membrane protease YdiL (CAAX protease family)|uniref:CPBP family intramembrane glutamic endopeptidase n=1 Tax=Rhodoferax sp. TaxID=50421 RepID=UPI001B440257|nr:CPBP family intramembrane glutamic endopeptidase [Rhodoferax sp.]MBP8285544.1 CPBP family intramembrane metalloprotease [Rhodoferax sp.]MBP9148336.1 CPBP family intramembrane metalloprotease [Rhodoferax sp.]MBP9737897.1 CPBP family intramembrane metalloprotease [Rhodoferax sp.]